MIGSHGILPVGEFLQAVREQAGTAAYWEAPTVFWWASSDAALQISCILGAIFSVFVIFGFFQRLMLGALFALYLSLVTAGQTFMSFQWDFLLLETGFLAIFLKPTLVRVWLLQWLLFRLMLESSEVKLLSGDVTWRNLTAMSYHYFTQPIPTPIAWYMYQAPLWFQKVSTGLVFVVELFAPFLIFGPRRLRYVGAAFFFGLQLLIFLTGNYTFFNLLTMALCILLLDDSLLKRGTGMIASPAGTWSRATSAILFFLVVTVSCSQLSSMLGYPIPFPRPFIDSVAPFGIVNTYGLFANMTTTRSEIAIEGSNDGAKWSEYTFRYKPGDVKRRPPWVAPHQPRLDWQMWFAALGNYEQNPWFENFMGALLRGSPPVLALLEGNPFPNAPPHYVRALIYDYRFTDFAARRATGAWWRRELKGAYFPAVSLKRGN